MEIKILKPIQGIILFLKICGLWPNHNNLYIPYMIYAIIFQFIFTFSYASFKIYNLFFLTEVNLITKTLFLCLGEAAFFIKVFNFHIYSKDIQQLLVDIKEFKFINQMENDLLQNRLLLFSKIAILYVGCAGCAIFSSLAAPLASTERVLPYPGWYPIDWHDSTFNYYLLYAYQVTGECSIAFAIILLETFALYLIIMACVHTDVLAIRLQRIEYYASDVKENETDSDKNSDRIRDNHLIECFKVYALNASFQKSFEDAFSIPFFVQFVVSGAILCVTVFQIVMMNPREEFVNFIFYFTYFLTLLSEIFLPCYFGTELMLKNGNLPTAIYKSNWIGSDVKYQKMIITFMELSKRPKFLMAGKLFTLSLSNFLLVVHRMYSLYAVLKNFFK